MTTDEVILGSGDLYLAEYVTSIIPIDTVIEVAGNLVGRISGGASLEYKPTTYEVADDKGMVLKRIVTKEEVTFKSGVLTWDLETLAKLCGGAITASVSEVKIKIGGAKLLTSYVLQFVHTKDDGFKLRTTLVVTASDGFTLAFTKDKETIVDAIFKALSQSDGTLIIIRDQLTAGV